MVVVVVNVFVLNFHESYVMRIIHSRGVPVIFNSRATNIPNVFVYFVVAASAAKVLHMYIYSITAGNICHTNFGHIVCIALSNQYRAC